jgi:hypothetical protein
MVCKVIDECRCYAYMGNSNQFCGVRRGSNVLPCPEDCCFGGCTNDGSRPPFRVLERPNKVFQFTPFQVNALILTAITVLFFLLYIDLKVTRVRKI